MQEEDSFLTSVEQEGAIQPDENNESENEDSEESSTEPNENEETPSQEGDNTPDETNIPFHKHPRWEAKQRELEELKESQAKLMQELESIKSSKTVQSDVKLPQSWIKRFGDSPESVEAYKEYLADEVEPLKQSLLKEFEAKQTEQQKQEQKLIEWVEGEVGKVADKHDINFEKDKSLKNEFLDFMNKRRPTDMKGNIDFLAGWDWFNETRQFKNLDKTKKLDERKKIANLTGADTKPEPAKDETPSASQLRRMSWSDLIN